MLFACGLALLLVCQLYGQHRQQQQQQPQKEARRSSSADAAAATAAAAAMRGLMMALPQGPKHACVSDDWMVSSGGNYVCVYARPTDRLPGQSLRRL